MSSRFSFPSTPPALDRRMIVLFSAAAAVAPQGAWMSPAFYAVRVVQARDCAQVDWAAVRWCYVEDLPALLAAIDTPVPAGAATELQASLAAATTKATALEQKIGQALAILAAA